MCIPFERLIGVTLLRIGCFVIGLLHIILAIWFPKPDDHWLHTLSLIFATFSVLAGGALFFGALTQNGCLVWMSLAINILFVSIYTFYAIHLWHSGDTAKQRELAIVILIGVVIEIIVSCFICRYSMHVGIQSVRSGYSRIEDDDDEGVFGY